jgi:hypothetical protein
MGVDVQICAATLLLLLLLLLQVNKAHVLKVLLVIVGVMANVRQHIHSCSGCAQQCMLLWLFNNQPGTRLVLACRHQQPLLPASGSCSSVFNCLRSADLHTTTGYCSSYVEVYLWLACSVHFLFYHEMLTVKVVVALCLQV